MDRPAPEKTAPRRRRLKLIAALVAGELAAIALVAYSLYRDPGEQVTVSVTDPAAAGPSGPPRTVQQQLLTDFLKLPAAEKPGLVTDGTALAPVMRAYYAGRDPDEIGFDAFEPADKASAQGTGLRSIWIAKRDGGLGPVVAAFKCGPDGRWTLDWPIYSQTYDCAFRNFAGRPEPAEAELRVMLTKLPGKSPGDPVRVRLADLWDQGVHAEKLEAPAAPEAAREIASALQDGGFSPATIRLKWSRSSPTDSLKPSVTALVSWGCHRFDSPDLPASAAPVANVN